MYTTTVYGNDDRELEDTDQTSPHQARPPYLPREPTSVILNEEIRSVILYWILY